MNCKNCGHNQKAHDQDKKHDCYFGDCTCEEFITEYCKCGHDMYRHNVVEPCACLYINYPGNNKDWVSCNCKQYIEVKQ